MGYMRIQGDTRGYKGIHEDTGVKQEDTRRYKKIQDNTGRYRRFKWDIGIQGVNRWILENTEGYRRLQKVLREYRGLKEYRGSLV